MVIDAGAGCFRHDLRATRRRWRGLAAATVALGLALPARAALAADLAAGLHVDAVTVYRSGALVTRRGRVEIPAGDHRLIVRNLPESIHTDALRIAVGSSSVHLGGIDIHKVIEREYVAEPERALRARIQKLEDERSALRDATATAELQLKLLDSLAAAPAGTPTKPAVDGANLAGVLATMAASANAARARIREARVSLRSLDAEVTALEAELKKIATARKATYEVRASLHASAGVTTTVTVEYVIGEAGWTWIHEARLDSGSRRVALFRRASVRQGGGEDWNDVALTLTTAEPAHDANTPDIAPLFVELREPKDEKARFEGLSRSVMSPEVAEIAATAAPYSGADVIATPYLVEYRIPGRVSVASDREPRLYPVATDEFAVSLVARVLPAAERSAYLEAAFKYDGDVPIQGGELRLFRDGAFVGSAVTRTLLPGADVRLPFGVDQRIRVVVHDEAEGSGDRGIIGRQSVEERKQRFEITSHHTAAVPIEVIGRVPVPRHDEIKVEVLKGATPPTVRDLDGKPGVYLWKLDAQPGQTATVRHYYSLQYPRGWLLVPRERAANAE